MVARKKTAKFKCEKCGKTFGMAMHLGRHMATAHGKSKAAPTAKTKPTTKASATTKDDLAGALATMINRLENQRQEHVDAIATIDAVFEKHGIQLPERKRRGRKPGGASATTAGPKSVARRTGRRKQGTFAKTGTQSILDFVQGKGKTGATSAEINKHWKAEGRGATADTTLSQLTKKKTLKRQKINGAKGSRYMMP